MKNRRRLLISAVPTLFLPILSQGALKDTSDLNVDRSNAPGPSDRGVLSHEKYDSQSDSDDSRDVISYCYSRRNVKDSVESDAEPEVPKQTHSNYKCNACGGPIEGFRYACVECADYDQCAECEASGAHAEHYVLRVPRVERAADVQVVLHRIRHELMQVDNPIEPKLEKDDDEEENVGEIERLVIKIESGESEEVDPFAEPACGGSVVGGGAVKQEVVDPEDGAKTACDQVAEAVGVLSQACEEERGGEALSVQTQAGEVHNIEARAGEASNVRKRAGKPVSPPAATGEGAGAAAHSRLPAEVTVAGREERPCRAAASGDAASREARFSELATFLTFDSTRAPRKRRKAEELGD